MARLPAKAKRTGLSEMIAAASDGSENSTRQRIINAALVCLDRWGLEKINLNDIAREAGVTRPTVYSYFANREEVIQAAMIYNGQRFAIKMLEHVARFTTLRDRFLETVMYAWKQMPNEPYLKFVKSSDLAQMVNEQAITSREGREICCALLAEVFQHDPKFMAEIDEITEVATRFLLSLLLVNGAVKRNDKQMREFLQRRLLPAVGLA